jgi:signal transduction histidine kinase
MAGLPAVDNTDSDLRAGFDAFIEASHRLEQRYAELKARAAAVDEQLQATNQRLAQTVAERDAIFAALPLGVIARRHDGTVTFQNDEAERLCITARAAGVELPAAHAGDIAIGDGGVRVRCADLPDGELVLLEDRSRIRELEREVHRLDRLAGLSELALGVAHEIKNPLNGAMGFAELLERNPEGEPARRYAARIRQGLHQVDEIVKSLLAFARPEAHRAQVATVATIVAEAAASAGLPENRLVFTGDGALRADAAAVTRVLAVLFRNALESGSELGHVRVAAEIANGRLELVVADDGPGVPCELATRVFEPFVSTKERGTGLGLPLAVRVLSFLGGELSLQNPGEKGARFCVRLPLHAANLPVTPSSPSTETIYVIPTPPAASPAAKTPA